MQTGRTRSWATECYTLAPLRESLGYGRRCKASNSVATSRCPDFLLLLLSRDVRSRTIRRCLVLYLGHDPFLQFSFDILPRFRYHFNIPYSKSPFGPFDCSSRLSSQAPSRNTSTSRHFHLHVISLVLHHVDKSPSH
jgi:hypothetical protein